MAKHDTTGSRVITTLSGAGILAMALAAAPVLTAPLVPQAWAQAGGMFGAGESDTVTVQATVKSIDLKTRTVVLVGQNGETKSLKVGPDVQNLPQVKPGDVVVARYRESVAYVIAAPGTKTPDDLLALATARATPGEKPAGGVEAKVVVTGLVVGVNPVANTISMVDPQGGEVRTLAVKDPEYQRMLPQIKVGDTVTAVISEALVAVVEPAK